MLRRWYMGITAGGFVSKLLGALREILLARYFGTGAVADAYRASMTATLSPVHLISSRLVQTCFIPLYASYREERPERGRALFWLLLGGFSILGLLLALLLFQFAQALVGLLLPGFDGERLRLAVTMLRITALGVPFYIYTSLLGALGAAQRDWLIPSLRPGMQNLGLLMLIVLAATTGRPELAAWGFTGSYVFLALLATVYLVWRGILPRGPRPDGRLLGEVGRALWQLFRPLILVSILVEAQILMERFLASLVGPGSVASMEYARFLTETSHTLLIVPLGLIGLGHFAGLSRPQLQSATDRNLARLILVLLPLSAILFMNGEALLRLIYLRGEFGVESLGSTHRALLGLSLGLWAFSGSYFLQRVFNARLENGVVLRGEALSALSAIAIMLASYRSLGLLGLGLAPSLGALLSLSYYHRRLGAATPRARRCLLLQLAVLPLYVLGAWLLGRIASGWVELLIQGAWAVGLWGGWLMLRRDLRTLLAGRQSDLD